MKGREARGAAERGHGQDAPSMRTLREGREDGAGGWRTLRSRGARELGRRSTVMRGVRSTLRIDGSWVREPRRRSPGRGVQPRWLGARRFTWREAKASCVDRRERPNPEPWWRELWRAGIPGEHRRAASAWPGEWGRRGTDSRGEQSFEAGVPAANRRAQCPRERDGTCGPLTERVEATGLANAGNLRHGS